MYIGETVGDNIVAFKSRINHHTGECRTGISICKFPIHVYHSAIKINVLKNHILN